MLRKQAINFQPTKGKTEKMHSQTFIFNTAYCTTDLREQVYLKETLELCTVVHQSHPEAYKFMVG